MTALPGSEQAKVEAFAGKVFADLSGMMATVMAVIGDRLGLFKDLAANGPATSTELAARTALQERYAREWLGGMASAGYLAYDPASRRFALPPEHAPALAQEDGAFFFGGAYQSLLSELRALDQVIWAFRQGGGVPQTAYDDDRWEGLERFTATRFENFLLQEWVPAVPEVQAKLRRGVLVADVGCGSGRALIKLAQAFPRSRYVGYDAYAPATAKATANAQAAGVADRVTFRHLDVADGLPEQYDLVTTFDVIHDAVSPRGLLRAICRGLRPDGAYLLLDINCSDKLEENAGPLGTVLHGFSLLYCLTTSLASGGEGLGTLGLPEAKVRELCAEAGFGNVRRLPLKGLLNALYEVKL